MVVDAVSKESRQEKMIGCLIVQPELQRDWIKLDFEVGLTNQGQACGMKVLTAFVRDCRGGTN